MAFRKVGFIGLGLIGGSIALKLKENNPKIDIIATAGRPATVHTAFRMGLIRNPEPLELTAFADCDYIFLCAPTLLNLNYLRQLKDLISDHTIITDVGSTKAEIHEEVIRLGLEKQFIGGHPMTGSEKTGIENAKVYLLENAYYVITPTAQTSPEVIREFTDYVLNTGAIPLLLDYKQHDFAVAAISHLPHMISFSLANLVKDRDDPNQTMKTIAAGSFRDMTRVAASSPVMWENICISNREPILELMDLYMEEFARVRAMVASSQEDELLDYFGRAKEYRDSLAVRTRKIHKDCFVICVDIQDHAGAIAVIASLLAFEGINIKNIGIINNREFSDGVLQIEFENQEYLDRAIRVLQERNYHIYRR